eukprot:XP_011678914.1 PREDICTED: uncharacterized protein LOC105445271 [Strongylocentrotus purpuratus]
MGSAKSRPRSLSFEEEVEDHSETIETCCCARIRKMFSKSKRPKSMALQVMEVDMDSDDDNDDVVLVNDSSNSTPATSIHSATGVEPWALQTSCSAPAVLGQDCHQYLIHSSKKVDDELPSTSYPKDVRVSSQYLLSYRWPERRSESTSYLWAVIINICSSISLFIYDTMKVRREIEEEEGGGEMKGQEERVKEE